MANGMTGLYIGASGLQSAQTALNTTAHNLANINVTGYTRQQVSLSSADYFRIGESATQEKSYGVGVDTLAIRRVRNDLIDKAYRQETGRLGYYSSQYEANTEVENLFGEMQGVTFQDQMEDLKDAISQLTTEPESTIKRGALLQMSTTFIDRANSIYQSLCDYQSTLNTKVSNTIDRINELGQTIYDLNKEILKIENTGERANDLRDQRDNALDELASYAKINYTEKSTGEVYVSLEGVAFVTDMMVTAMDKEVITGTDLYRPVWPGLDNRAVFNEYEDINSIDNNDIGELKGLLLARGNTAVNYKSVPVMPEATDYAQGSSDPQYIADMAQYQEDCDYYNKYIDTSVILKTMAGLDKLVNGMVTALNDILCPEVTYSTSTPLTYTDAAGNTVTLPASETVVDANGNTTYNYKILDLDSTGVGMDDDETVGTELFARNNTERYIKMQLPDPSNPGTTKTQYVFNTLDELGNYSDYTLGNIEVNETAIQHKELLPLSIQNDGGEDFDRAMDLLEAWDVKFAALNPSKFAKEDFGSFYNSMVSQFATNGQVLKNMVDTQTTMSDSYDAQRLETEGVSSDEELQNMIKYQQAYNAASRYVNVVSEMLETIIERLGS
jgi:flagellar hook-associated protein 1 FlgK